MGNCLTSQAVLPLLDCYFVFQRRNWQAATMRQQGIETEISVHRVHSAGELTVQGAVRSGSVVLVEFPIADMSNKAFLAMIWQLTMRRIYVVVAGNEREIEVLSQALMVGAICVVTREEDCDKVARVIERARELQIPEFVDWKDGFYQQLPWPPV